MGVDVEMQEMFAVLYTVYYTSNMPNGEVHVLADMKTFSNI